jgi:hypothetical protein
LIVVDVDEYDLNGDDVQQAMMLMIQVLIQLNLLMRHLNFDDELMINSGVEIDTKQQI